ncbi:hypothetical protein RYX36_011051 [Vicia faba]
MFCDKRKTVDGDDVRQFCWGDWEFVVAELMEKRLRKDRWQKILNLELVKGPWSKEEDEVMIELVNRIGPKKWSTIAQHLSGRIRKKCRERRHNHLNPAINKEALTQEEELVGLMLTYSAEL